MLRLNNHAKTLIGEGAWDGVQFTFYHKLAYFGLTDLIIDKTKFTNTHSSNKMFSAHAPLNQRTSSSVFAEHRCIG